MRIVFLNASAQLGGAETSLLAMTGALRQARPEWQLTAILPAEGPLAPKLETLGLEVRILELPQPLSRLGDQGLTSRKALAAGLALRPYLRELRAALSGAQPDVIHAAGFKCHVLACWARPANVPVLWHIHDYVSRRRIMSRVLRAHAHRCSFAFVNSNSVAADLALACPGLPSQVVYNAIDTARFQPAGHRAGLDVLSGLDPAPAGTRRVGLVATFAHWKGHSVFLKAIARLRGLPIRAYIIGGPIYSTDGSQRTLNELKREASELGIAANVGFTGFVEDTPSALRALDIVVHASTEPEPFGMVLIEGMACAKPVIAALSGGAAEIVEDEQNGLGHTPGDDAALAEQIRRLVLDPALAERLAHNGRRAAEDRFTAARFAEQTIPVYDRLARSYGRATGVYAAANA